MPADLGIAVVGLTDADSHRLRTAVGMAFASGAIKQTWKMCEPAAANLVVVSADSAAGLAAAAAATDGRRFYAVLASENDPVPDGVLTLPWPIRLENVASLLTIVGARVEKGTTDVGCDGTAEALPDAGSHDLLRLASLLRDGGSSPGAIWCVEGLAKRPLHVAPSDRAFFFGESLMVLRELDAGARLNFVPVPKEELTLLAGRKPIVMLQWLVGLQTTCLGLLPWIDRRRPLRLSRYPEFQMLHHQPAHRRIAAALSRPRSGIEAVVEATGEPTDVVVGFVNAASLCGCLASVSQGAAAAAAPRGSSNVVRRSLFASFRKALGITNASA